MKNKNMKRMLKIYSLTLATFLLISSPRKDLNKYEDIQEYPWTGGVITDGELICKRKGEKGIIYKKRR